MAAGAAFTTLPGLPPYCASVKFPMGWAVSAGAADADECTDGNTTRSGVKPFPA